MKWSALAFAAFLVLISPRADAQPCVQTWNHDFHAGQVDNTVWCLSRSLADHVPGLIVGGDFSAAGSAGSWAVVWDGSDYKNFPAPIAGRVRATAVFPFGRPGNQQPQLVVAGMVGGGSIQKVARWTGTAWAPVGALNAEVFSLAVYDDGHGPALYAALRDRVMRWYAGVWEQIVPNMAGDIYALTVFDPDGPGPGRPVLILGGLSFANGTSYPGIASWDGATLSSLGTGVAFPAVNALAVGDLDGRGPALYVGGGFTTAGGGPAAAVAKWDGTTWAGLGSGLVGGTGAIGTQAFALTIADEDGPGPLPPGLIVGGFFTAAGGVPASNIARWREGRWSGFSETFNGIVRTLETMPENGVDVPYAGGEFTAPGSHVTRLVNSSWRPLGNEPNDQVFALAEMNGGAGPELWAGGYFTTVGGGQVASPHVAAWNGTAWRALGGGIDGDVDAFAMFNDGTGLRAFAAGFFTAVGGQPALNAATYSSAGWRQLGGGVTGVIRAAATFDEDGAGPLPPALFVGGQFTTSTGAPISNFARWDGTAFTPIASTVSLTGTGIYDMKVWDDGSGPALFIAGDPRIGGSPVGVVKWNGSTWTALPGPFGGGITRTLEVFDDGGGPALFIGGAFTTVSGAAVGRVVKWNGTTVTDVGAGFSWGSNATVEDLVGGPGPGGPGLFAVGRFTTPGLGEIRDIAVWRAGAWSTVGAGPFGPTETVHAAAIYDSGSGPNLYVTGDFTSMGGSGLIKGIAKWNGTTWSQMGSGLDGTGYAMEIVDTGSGPKLYIGGQFYAFTNFNARGVVAWNGSSLEPAVGFVDGSQAQVAIIKQVTLNSSPTLLLSGDFLRAGVVSAKALARWSGSDWEGVGSGADGYIYALCVMNDGSGTALYAAGSFTSINGVAANRIARWNGTTWTPLGVGVTGAVHALCAFDDGTGPALYVGGFIQSAGGIPCAGLAKWKNGSWSLVGQGVSGGLGVNALTVFTDTNGTALYVGGDFTTASPGGGSAARLARWNGSTFSALPGPVNNTILSLTTLQDVSGQQLIIGGRFTAIGAVQAKYIGKWDGTSWSAMSGGMGAINPQVNALATFDDGNGRAVFAGGGFATAGGISEQRIARWGCTGGAAVNCYVNCDGSTASPILTANDFQCFLNKFAQNANYANCDQSTSVPVLNANDFQCFLNKFAAGCS